MSNMNLDLTTTEIVNLLKKRGWDAKTPLDGVFVGNEVRVRVFNLVTEFVKITRTGPDKFKIVAVKYQNC